MDRCSASRAPWLARRSGTPIQHPDRLRRHVFQRLAISLADPLHEQRQPAIAFKPNHASAIEGRGRTYFYLGNFAQAAADLQRGLALDSADVYGALWLHLARQRLRQDDSDDFAAHAALADSTRWPEPIVRYLRGGFGADSLRALAAAAEVAGQGPRCAVSFYLGEEALLGGETDTARSLFEETRTTCPKELHEHRAAVAELQRIARSPMLTERSDSAGNTPATSR
jgi:lipoprotein NlpI